MLTENDAIVKILKQLEINDWRNVSTETEELLATTFIDNSGIVQIDPRYTTHA